MKAVTIAVESVLKKVLFVLMLLITISVIWQVFSRYIFNNPATWPDEIARFSMIWVALLGGVYVYAQERHLAVTILPEKLGNSPAGNMLQILFHVLVAFLGVLVLLGGYNVTRTNFVNGQLSAVLHINMGYVYTSVPMTGVLLIFYAICFILREIERLVHPVSSDKGVERE